MPVLSPSVQTSPIAAGTGLGVCQTLVGDIVMAIREAIVDLPPTLPVPTGFTAVAVTDAASTLAVGTYYLRFTVWSNWGETLPQTGEVTITIVSGQGISIQGTLPPGAVKVRAYFGTAAGAENQFVEATTLPFNIEGTGVGGQIPTRNTAFNPDLDGGAFSAAMLFRWVNDMLGRSAWLVGGFLDMSGSPSVTGMDSYVAPGEWRKIDTFWKDGYPLAPDQQGNYFFRNPITANVLTSVTTVLYTDRMMFQVWPQADRTSAVTTLAQAMTTTDGTAVLADASGFLQTAGGFVQIDSEIMRWMKISGNSLVSIIRGMGGTSIVAHAAGAAVTELNIWWKGYRMFCSNYVPGQASSPIPVPIGWANVFVYYGLHRARLAEQDMQQADSLLEKFDRSLTTWYRANKVTTGPRQVGQNTYGLEVIPTIGGGWVVPAWIVPVFFTMHYFLDKTHQVWYLLLVGGAVCLQLGMKSARIRRLRDRITSMLCVTHARGSVATSGCQRSLRGGSSITSGTTGIITKPGVHGCRSYFRLACIRSWKFLKSATFKRGDTVSVTG